MKEIPGYEGLYSVSKEGEVYSERRGIFLKKCLGGGGRYLSVSLRKDGENKMFMVHRLVALAFVENPDGKPEVNHKDGDRKNNAAKNLEWCTRSENMKHAVRTGLLVISKETQFKKGFDKKRNDKSKLSEDQVREIRRRHANGEKFSEIARDYDLNQSNIRRCCTRQYYSSII